MLCLRREGGGEGGGEGRVEGLLQTVEALGPGGEGSLAVQGVGVGGRQAGGHDLSEISSSSLSCQF